MHQLPDGNGWPFLGGSVLGETGKWATYSPHAKAKYYYEDDGNPDVESQFQVLSWANTQPEQATICKS